MMGLVKPPEVPVLMLPALHPVDVVIGGGHEQRHLEPERPAPDQLEAREASESIEPRHDEREDDNAEDVVLRDRVQRKVVKKSFAKKRLTFAVRDDTLEQRQKDCAPADRC